MAKYPVEISDSEGIIDGLNYLLSGPGGLGQDFNGVSYDGPAYLAGSFTAPYMSETPRDLLSNFIAIDTGEFLDAKTLQINFSGAPLGYVPFDNGDRVIVLSTSDPNVNGYYDVGVVECTEDYVILRDPTAATPTPGPFTGGIVTKTITYNAFYPEDGFLWIPTDCNSYATITGETDRVFISGQIDFGMDYYISTGGPYTLKTHIAVNRYKAIPGQPTVNPKINFSFDGTVADVAYADTGLTTSGTIPFRVGPTFISVIDDPGPGYYWYVIEIFSYKEGGTGIWVTSFIADKRSLSTQVVKQ